MLLSCMFQSPAYLCSRIEIGDEVVQVNGQMVVSHFISCFCRPDVLLIMMLNFITAVLVYKYCEFFMLSARVLLSSSR